MSIRHIFRWDLDKTYLKTELESMRGLYRTARASAEERENIPGSAALVRAVRGLVPQGEKNLVYFLSGSPNQMRAVIEKKFALDGIAPDGLLLKPTVSDLFRGRFRAITNQVAYKLGALLRGRSEAPVGTRETLIGDDAESDAFIYALYADIVHGRVPVPGLRKILKLAGAYGDQIGAIESEMEAVIHEDAVKRVIIHLDQLTPPAAFLDYFPLLVPIYNHLQTSIVLALDGTLSTEGIRLVARELLEHYGFDEQQLVNSAEDILRRRRVHHPPEALFELSKNIRELGPALDRDKGKVGRAEELLTGVLHKIADRADLVSSRPLPKSPTTPALDRNFEELFLREQARREEAKKARKQQGKNGKAGLTALPAEIEPDDA